MIFSFLKNKLTPEEKFWKWFSSNSEDYLNNLEKKSDILLPLLGKKLRELDKNLTFQFSVKDKNGKREFVISADGIKATIPAVFKLIEYAPNLEKWNIVAFRQREKDFPLVEFQNLRLSVNDIYFEAFEEGSKTGLNLYIKNYDGSEKYMGAAFILLDNNIGEYDVMTKIGSIEFKKLDENNKKGLKTLRKLPILIDAKKTKTQN